MGLGCAGPSLRSGVGLISVVSPAVVHLVSSQAVGQLDGAGR